MRHVIRGMPEINLSEQEVTVLLDELEALIEIAAEDDANERLRVLTSIKMKLESD